MAETAVATLSELVEARPVKVEAEGVPVCLVRLGDEVKAVHDTCSHQQWSLADGEVFDNGIECSLHGSTFDLDSGGPSSLPALKAVPTFEARVVDDEVLLDVDAPTNDAPFPHH